MLVRMRFDVSKPLPFFKTDAPKSVLNVQTTIEPVLIEELPCYVFRNFFTVVRNFGNNLDEVCSRAWIVKTDDTRCPSSDRNNTNNILIWKDRPSFFQDILHRIAPSQTSVDECFLEIEISDVDAREERLFCCRCPDRFHDSTIVSQVL